MIISRTPYRVSFFGGGSDYSGWYKQYGGRVLSTTINKHCHILLRGSTDFQKSKYKVMWSKTQLADKIDDIEHPSVRGCLKYLGVTEGVEIIHAGDLPSRSGLGSSSAFTVGLLNTLHAFKGITVGRGTLASRAIAVEQEVLKETVGIQDQVSCAWGGLNVIDIESNGAYSIKPLMLSEPITKRVQSHLVLIFTDLQRYASDVAREQVENLEDNRDHMFEMLDLVYPAANALVNGDMHEFGKLLHRTWMLKRRLSGKISNRTIDDLYEQALNAGAYGGKLLGAGSGGFMLLCVPPERRQDVLTSLGKIHVQVEFEYSGSKLVLTDR